MMERPSEQVAPGGTGGVGARLQAAGPKRILSLDGGGIRGLLSLGILERIETLLRQRHGGGDDFRLCDYFDLIAGTSTGAIIAALLAQGAGVGEAIGLYRELATTVFRTHPWRLGMVLPRYDEAALARFLRDRLGPDCLLGDPERLRTGLLVVTKRLDTGSPWPIGNNPFGRYFAARPGNPSIPNSAYPLWRVVRASTAAPTFFAPEWIEIAHRRGPDGRTVVESGNFVDGGVSPHNNPSLQAYLYATLRGYGLGWDVGAERLLIVSVGTGRLPAARRPSWISAVSGVTALRSLMDDCAALVEALMQGMGEGPEGRRIDPELEDLRAQGEDGGRRPQLVGEPRFHYLRCDVKLFHDPAPRDGVTDDPLLRAVLERPRRRGDPGAAELLRRMQRMDDPRAGEALLALGRGVGAAKLRPEHFPPQFDLPGRRGPGGRRRYRRRPGHAVQAIRLTLATEGFRYEKWGGLQTCKQGDWIVRNGEEVYSVDAESFARTYRPLGDGRYEKTGAVWAEPARQNGVVRTREGETHYRAGDYLVSNRDDGGDSYAVRRETFLRLYEPAEEAP